jgi:Ca-activated chloride channel family protein
MRSLLFFLFWAIISSFNAQVVFEKTKHDFGNLTMNSDRFVDIKLTNKGVKKAYILTVKKPGDVVYLVSGQFMEKDSSLLVRMQVNPMKKGKFAYEVQISTSDKDAPTIIKLNGNLKEFSQETANYLQACPDFTKNSKDRNAENNFAVTVVTIDKETKEFLSESSVLMIQNGRPTSEFITNKKGEFVKQFPLGFTYIYASHKGYYPTEMGVYVNNTRKFVMVELEKNKEVPFIKENENITADTTQKQLEENLSKALATEEPTKIELPQVIGFSELDKNNFDVALFKPVNVVFVLDISSSMKIGEKMELMKYSLYQLTTILRPQDQIAIVTYSTTANILLESIQGDKKTEINAKVDELKAAGLTAGGDGIKLGYKEALKNYLPDGVNQVFVITDGAFNRNSSDYKKAIKKYKKKGINLSVVGIQNSEKDKISMEEVAILGGGRYIPIYKLVDAQNNLKQEIRFISFRKI